ncbi:hypothetical protein GF382_02805 [Candidatus Falkowbacteria bacterium]|nr:hypothetical protein [Candidatus Falkowbacteria bacterium]
METFITFIRHGNNNFVKEGTPWHPGPKLNKRGIKEANLTGKYLKDFPFDMIISSDMNRARQTAEIINKYQKSNKDKKFDNIVFIRELSEHDEVIYSSKKRGTKKYKEEMLKARVTLKFFKQLLKEYAGAKIMIVAHGNVIRACLGTAMGFKLEKSPELNLFNCSISTLVFKDSDIKSIFHVNAVDHHSDRSFKRKLSAVKFISNYSALTKPSVFKRPKNGSLETRFRKAKRAKRTS